MTDNRATAVLRDGQRVRLEDETGVIYVSEVSSVAEDSMVVRLLDEAPEDAFPKGATAFIGVAGPRGLSRLKAVVDDFEGDDHQVLDLTPLGEFELQQRRREPRVPISFSIPCRRYGAAGYADTKSLASENLSAGGLRAVSKERFATGDVVELDLPIESAEPLTVTGLVVTARAEGRTWVLHIAFTQLPTNARHTIERYVSEQLTSTTSLPRSRSLNAEQDRRRLTAQKTRGARTRTA